MAPREVNTPEFPDTLPEDFAEWDGGEQQPATAPVKQAPAPTARPTEIRPPAATRVVAPEREVTPHQPVIRTAKAAPAPPKAAPKADADQGWQPPRPKQQSAPAKADFAPAINQRQAEAKLAEALWPEGEPKKKAKSEEGQGSRRGLLIGVGAAVVVAGLGGGAYFVSRSHTQSHPAPIAQTTTLNPAEPAEGAMPMGSPAGKPDPRNANSANNVQSQSASAQSSNQSASQQNAQDASSDNSTTDNSQQQAPPQNVNMAQFTAQSQIPRGGQQPTEPAPSGNIMMGGGTAAPIIGGSSNEHVQFVASKPIDVSSAALQLTRRTTPDYPEIARNSHVSGVVTVAITITPQGTVADARAVNGPSLLRQPAVNAVRNWRFKPYMVNGHPVPVTSEVNVNFAIQ